MFIPSTLFSTDIFWSGIKWLIFLVIWSIFAYGTWREDRKVRELLKRSMDENDTARLMHTLHRRDLQIWLQLSLLFLIVAVNDLQHDASLLPTDFFAAPAPPAPPPVASASDELYDRTLKKNANPNLPFSNITEFNEKNGKREAYIDWLKERYESWIVTYFYLQKCKQTGANDYALIEQSLAHDLSNASAAKGVEDNILMAATGSYKEMYSDIPCDSAHVASTRSMYDANMQPIRRPVTAAPAATAATAPAKDARH